MKRWSYWAKLSFQILIYCCVASMIYGLIMSISSTTSFKLQDWMSLSYSWGLLMYLLMLTMINSSRFISAANLTLSMGETRKNTLIGINLSNFIGLLSIAVVSFAVVLASDGTIISVFNALVSISCIYILAAGLGLCCGTMSEGSTATIRGFQLVFMFVSITIVFVAAFFTGIFDGMSMTLSTDNKLASPASSHTVALIITAVAGITFYIIGNIRMRNKLATFEVSL